MSDKYFEIQQLIYRWAWGHDSHDPDLVATTFAKEAEAMGASGRDAIGNVYREAYKIKSAQRRHALTNFLVLEDGDEKMVVQHYLTLYIIRGKTVELHLTGVYRDTVVLEDGEWKIFARTTILDAPNDPGDLPLKNPAGTY